MTTPNKQLEKIVDALYQNEEVEGVAIFTHSGEIIENQLILTESSLRILSETVAKITTGLQAGNRKLKGFLIKSPTRVFLICILDNYIITLHLGDDYSASKIDKNVRSLMENAHGLTSPKQTPPPTKPEPVTAAASNIEPKQLLTAQSKAVETPQTSKPEPTKKKGNKLLIAAILLCAGGAAVFSLKSLSEDKGKSISANQPESKEETVASSEDNISTTQEKQPAEITLTTPEEIIDPSVDEQPTEPPVTPEISLTSMVGSKIEKKASGKDLLQSALNPKPTPSQSKLENSINLKSMQINSNSER